MKLLISGSRGIKSFDLTPYIPADTDMIICGGAAGIDTLAEEYADRMRLSKMVFRPQYSRYGRAAPLKRNEEMVRLADTVLIIWDGKSSGTRHTMDYARKMGKDVRVVHIPTSGGDAEDE